MPADLWEEARALIAARSRPGGLWRALFAYSPREGFPRFHLDRYGEWWLATFHAPELASEELDALLALLTRTAAGVVLKFRNDDRKIQALGRVVAGDPALARALVVDEGGYRFEARLASSLDAGAYPDAEPLRAELLARSAGKRVLNLFAYTCLFGVAASKGGARGVINVDVSRHCLRWGQRNYVLNGLRVDGRDFVAEDAGRFCRRQARAGERFDAIVVDPPPFYSTGKVRRSSEERIEEDLEAALALASPAGATVHFLQCTARVSVDELATRIEAALAKHGRPASVTVHAAAGPLVSPNELAPTFKEARIRLEPTS